MNATDIIGFLGIVALAVVVGFLGGMRLSTWAVRREQRAWRVPRHKWRTCHALSVKAQEGRREPFLRLSSRHLLG
jgi:hypothetical protein